MTKFQSFDHSLSWAEVDESSGAVRKLSLPASLALTVGRAASQGWFSRSAGKLLAFGWWRDDLYVWLGTDRLPARATRAELSARGHVSTLVLHHSASKTIEHTFPTPSRPATSGIDPTNDEHPEDVDFATWMAATLSNEERVEHLQAELAPRVK